MRARWSALGLLLVLVALPCLAYYGEESLLFENFQAVSPPALPAGWVVLNPNGDAGQWQTREYGGVKWGRHCIRYISDPVQAANDWFFTAAVNLPGGVPCTITFMSRTSSAAAPLNLEVLAGTSQAPGGMVYTMAPIHAVAWEDYTEESGSFVPPATGLYYIGFHVQGPPAMARLYVDDVDVTIPETDLVISVGMTKEIDLVPLVFSPNDTMEACVVIENTGTGTPVLNKRFSVGRWPSDTELDFYVTGPAGRLPVINMFAKMGDLKAAHFSALAPDSLAGKTLNLWGWYQFDMPGAYQIEVRYRNYSDPAGLGAWKGELVSDPITITIQ